MRTSECLFVWTQLPYVPSCRRHEEPCLHRILAECQPGGVVKFADDHGLLAFPVPKHLDRRKVRAGDVLPPEPLETWQDEIGKLRRLTGLWDSILANERQDHTRLDESELRRVLRQPDTAKRADLIRMGRQRLGRTLAEKLERVRFALTVSPDGENAGFVIRYQPATLIDALWQRFAEEIAGIFTCAKCPAPGCGRWFLRSAGRSDKAYCSHRRRMRRLRDGRGWPVGSLRGVTRTDAANATG